MIGDTGLLLLLVAIDSLRLEIQVKEATGDWPETLEMQLEY